MASTGNTQTAFNTLRIADVEIEVEVGYVVHSYGTPEFIPSYGNPEAYDVGSGPEVEVTAVVAVNTGLDLTHLVKLLPPSVVQGPGWKLRKRDGEPPNAEAALLDDVTDGLEIPHAPTVYARSRVFAEAAYL